MFVCNVWWYRLLCSTIIDILLNIASTSLEILRIALLWIFSCWVQNVQLVGKERLKCKTILVWRFCFIHRIQQDWGSIRRYKPQSDLIQIIKPRRLWKGGSNSRLPRWFRGVSSRSSRRHGHFVDCIMNAEKYQTVRIYRLSLVNSSTSTHPGLPCNSWWITKCQCFLGLRLVEMSPIETMWDKMKKHLRENMRHKSSISAVVEVRIGVYHWRVLSHFSRCNYVIMRKEVGTN